MRCFTRDTRPRALVTLWVIVGTFGLVHSIPADEPAPAKNEIPAEAKAALPREVESFLVQRATIGEDGTEVLIHIWGAPRPNTEDSLNRYNRFTNSPFCVDILARRTDAETQATWRLISSAGYMATDPPSHVRTHWLQPEKKQGPILEIVWSNGAPGVSTAHTILVWDKGFMENTGTPAPQSFFSGGAGGGTLKQSFEAVDERGFTTVQSIDSFAGRVKSVTVHQWNGRSFEPVTTKAAD